MNVLRQEGEKVKHLKTSLLNWARTLTAGIGGNYSLTYEYIFCSWIS